MVPRNKSKQGEKRKEERRIGTMGITGLLPFLKNASKPVHVKEISHSVVAIDVYCWLHKGAFGCAEKLVQGQPTVGYILYTMKYLDMLLHHNIKPVLVFDGRHLPSKAGTEKKRRENRQKYKAMALQHLRDGDVSKAGECMRRCIDITPQMAREVIKACQERNIDCIVAPHEADAQLAWLNLNGVAHYVITEDSDLTLFGCDKIIFKLDLQGHGVLYEKSKLPLTFGKQASSFDFDKFRHMCIMSGCDYLPSLPGIGLGKAHKFWGRVMNPNLKQVLPKIPSYLNMHNVKVTQEYIDGFIQANRTFLHQIVFDVRERKLKPLNPYPEHECLDREDLSFAGTLLEDEVALQLSLGNLDLNGLEKVCNFDPDGNHESGDNSTYGKRAKHHSIWADDFKRDAFLLDENQKPVSSSKKSEESDSSKTAFGDFKISDKAKKRAAEKRASLAKDLEVKAQKRVSFQNEITIDSSTSSQEEERLKKVYVSKYFDSNEKLASTKSKTKPESPKAPRDDFVPRPPQRSPEPDKSRKPGDWFADLDKDTKADGKVIYRPEVDLAVKLKKEAEEEAAKAKENTRRKKRNHFSKFGLSALDTLEMRNSLATKNAFKPVASSSQESNASSQQSASLLETPEKANISPVTEKKRNPFAKKWQTPQKKTKPPEQNSQDDDDDLFASNKSKTGESEDGGSSSQLFASNDLAPNNRVNSCDSDSFRFTPKVGSVTSSQSLSEAGSSQEELYVTQGSSASQFETRSSYFGIGASGKKRSSSEMGKVSSQPLSKRPKKVGSGLLKPKGQKSIMDWARRST